MALVLEAANGGSGTGPMPSNGRDGIWRKVNRSEPVEFMHHRSTKTATFLIGLRSGLEGGAFTAFPDDTKVSSSRR